MAVAIKPLIEHIYIHVPFCLKKCGYCSFYSEKYDPELVSKYASFLQKEIELFQAKFLIKPKTIYFGGGTPSLLEADQIAKLLSKFKLDNIKEITLEANPINIDLGKVKAWRALPLNRISLGVQSFLAKELKLLGRLHNNTTTQNAWSLLKKEGFSNLSLDLIYGLPFQKQDDVEFSVEAALKLEPQHISLYCLSLDPHVPLYPARQDLPADDEVADLYRLIRAKLQAEGYEQYEISNFARPGFESHHNLAYWSDKLYLGLGPAAAGYVTIPENGQQLTRSRYVNPADLKEYFNLLERKKIMPGTDILSPEQHQAEYIFLNLRKTEGLDLKEFQQLFQIDLLTKFQEQIDQLLELNLIELGSNFLRLKPEAYFVSNEIFNEFI